jgi:hypothetical protein
MVKSQHMRSNWQEGEKGNQEDSYRGEAALTDRGQRVSQDWWSEIVTGDSERSGAGVG